ncbi:MAG: glycosyltransferase [Bacteroidales bacterium]|nr:glycosyltransferase [Bacteroidales bacterium]
MAYKKKILVFIDWFLPGYKAGGPIRSVANLTAHLSDEFEFYIITRDTDYLETEPYASVKSNQWQEIAKNIHVFYFSKDFLSVKNIKNTIQTIDFDTVYINGIYSFYFSLLPVWLFRKSKKKIVVASRGMLSKQSFSSKNLKKKLFITFAQFFNFYKNVFFHTTNENEKQEIAKLNLKTSGFIIAPNLAPKISFDRISRTKKIKKLKLLSIARISKEKNILFAIQLLVKNKFKGKIEFDLYGSIYQPEYWNQCIEFIKTAPASIRITYKGIIDNKKIPEIIKDYHFSFLPSLGENFGHSILESMSFACPVIISDRTPWRNLEKQKAGWDIALDDEQKFIDTIQYCLDMNQKMYDEWSEAAYRFAKSFSENPQLIEQSKQIFY